MKFRSGSARDRGRRRRPPPRGCDIAGARRAHCGRRLPVGRGGGSGARLDADDGVGSGAGQPGRGEARTPGRQAACRADRSRRRRDRRARPRRQRVVRRARADGGHRDRQLGERRSSGVRPPAGRDRLGSSAPRPSKDPRRLPRPPRPTMSPPASRSARPTPSPPALRLGATGSRAARVPDSRSSARATSRARIAVGTHEARWQRWTASLELAWRWAARDRLVIDPHGGVTVGWLSTEGVDYAQNASASAASIGATAGIRTAWWTWRRAALWMMSGAPTSRDGTPFTGPEGPPWTRRPPRAGAVSPASASRSGGPPFPVRFGWRRAVHPVSCPLPAPRSASRSCPGRRPSRRR